jgi:hypothetical protein
MKKCLLLFPSIHDLIRAERVCRRESLPVQVLPVPREISSDCGMVLEIESSSLERFRAAAGQEGLEVKVYSPS